MRTATWQFVLFLALGAFLAWLTVALLPPDGPAIADLPETADRRASGSRQQPGPLRPSTVRPNHEGFSGDGAPGPVPSSVDSAVRDALGTDPTSPDGRGFAAPAGVATVPDAVRARLAAGADGRLVLRCGFGGRMSYWIGIAGGSAHLTDDDLTSAVMDTRRTADFLHLIGRLPDGRRALLTTFAAALGGPGQYHATISGAGPVDIGAHAYGTCDSLLLEQAAARPAEK